MTAAGGREMTRSCLEVDRRGGLLKWMGKETVSVIEERSSNSGRLEKSTRAISHHPCSKCTIFNHAPEPPIEYHIPQFKPQSTHQRTCVCRCGCSGECCCPEPFRAKGHFLFSDLWLAMSPGKRWLRRRWNSLQKQRLA